MTEQERELDLLAAELEHEARLMRARNERLEKANSELLEALESVWLWMENQSDGQSKGGHATFDLMMLREQRDIARAVIAKHGGQA